MTFTCNFLVAVSVVGIVMTIQGCGDDGSSTGGSGSTTMTTSPHIPSRSHPMTTADAAEYLNKLYNSYGNEHKTNQTSSGSLGVTISMAAKDKSFFKNLYCSDFLNPALGKHTGCYQGQADCRMSACLISHAWMIDKKTKAPASFGNRDVGYVFNQTMVETKWTKCSFVWDGASGNRYNRGCGAGAPTTSCTKGAGSAWFNVCPSTGKTCVAADEEVKRDLCNIFDGGEQLVPPTHDGEVQCIFPGVAFNYHGQSNYMPEDDQTHVMVEMRMKYNDGSDASGPNIEKNNEVVLDEKLLIPDFWNDPVMAVPAFVYTRSNMPISRVNAASVRDEFCKYYYCSLNGGGDIPLVMLDDVEYHGAKGPFVADISEDSTVAV